MYLIGAEDFFCTFLLSKRRNLYVTDQQIDETLFLALLRKLDFSRTQIEELILKFKPAMILVEHDKSFVEHIATSVISIP